MTLTFDLQSVTSVQVREMEYNPKMQYSHWQRQAANVNLIVIIDGGREKKKNGRKFPQSLKTTISSAMAHIAYRLNHR